MKTSKFSPSVLKTILGTIGPYFMDGVINYAAVADQKSIAAENFLNNPEAFGVPKDKVAEIKSKYKAETYIIDFLFSHAGNIDEIHIFTKDPFFVKSFEKQLKTIAPEVKLNNDNTHLIILTVPDTEIAKPAEEINVQNGTLAGTKADIQKTKMLYVGVPVTNKVPGMLYNNELKYWESYPEENLLNIKYIKYEEGTPFPEYLHKHPYIAYSVDNIDTYMKSVDQVIYGPINMNNKKTVFALIHDTAIALIEK